METRWYPTQSHYLDTEPTSPCPILIISSAWLGSNKYKFICHSIDLTSVQTHEVWIPQSPKTGDGHSTHSAIPAGAQFVMIHADAQTGWSPPRGRQIYPTMFDDEKYFVINQLCTSCLGSLFLLGAIMNIHCGHCYIIAKSLQQVNRLSI